LNEVMQRVGNGDLRALPVRTFPRAETIAAFRHMAHARHIGKIAIEHPLEVDNLVTPRGTYLVTGGLRGLGLRVADRLVARGARSLVLTARSAPSEEAGRAIRHMQQQGAEVHVVQGDIADAADVERLFRFVHALGRPLRGIVHSAGALADAPLVQQTWSDFEKVFAAKVHGTNRLVRHTRTDHLDFFVLFSSIASVLGSPGQANHCAANSYMDVLAHQCRSQGLPAACINWGIWSGTGAAVDRGVIERAAARGLGAIDPEDGLAMLETLLCAERAQTMVQPIEWPRFLDNVTKDCRPPPLYSEFAVRTPQKPAGRTAPESAASAGAELSQMPAAARRTFLAKVVRRAAATVLELETGDAIPDDLPLKEAGLDSLLAVELRNALGKAIGQRLPSTLLFDYPTIGAVVAYLQSLFVAAGDEPGKKTDDQPALRRAEKSGIDDLLQEVESLSVDEAERLVGEGSR
jgi:NAD(P)-dependent dehydrogenase (short-subunit alcohol dehydrogenase family)/acyl carrier protein